VATTGIGVQDTLKAVVKLVLLHLTRKYETKTDTRAASAAADRAPRPASVVVPAAAQQAPGAERGQPLPMSGADTSVSAPAAMGLAAASETAAAEAPRSTPPPPPDFRGFRGGVAAEETSELSFENREIEDLVGEVEDFDETAPAMDDIEWTPPRQERAEAASSVEEVPIEIIEEETPAGAHAAESADDVPEQAPRRKTQFEVDRGFDPSWQTGEAGSGAGTREVEGAGAAEEALAAEAPPDAPPQPTPIPVRHAEEAPPKTENSEVVLEEVAGTKELFEDPGLDVARLRAGEAREILVPVEIVEGTALRRFKLSLRLLLDRLD